MPTDEDGSQVTRVLLSVPWTWSFGEPDRSIDDVEFRVGTRTSDWGLTPWRARLRLLRDAGLVAWQAAGHDCVVLSTLGAEAALMAALAKLRSHRTRVLVFDFLAPRLQPPGWLARHMFAAVDRFVVIRSGDTTMLQRRFGVEPSRCTFLAWPVRADHIPVGVREDGYVYAAGWAHRDWATLVAALDRAGLDAILATGHPLEVPVRSRDRIKVIGMPTPDEGRALTAGAGVVAVVMTDTDLPSGPLVLLDAMAAGKAVVATDVNGTRDYVSDGATALVVPPGDPSALANALTQLSSDAVLRDRLGRAAREETLKRWTVPDFWRGLADLCR